MVTLQKSVEIRFLWEIINKPLLLFLHYCSIMIIYLLLFIVVVLTSQLTVVQLEAVEWVGAEQKHMFF